MIIIFFIFISILVSFFIYNKLNRKIKELDLKINKKDITLTDESSDNTNIREITESIKNSIKTDSSFRESIVGNISSSITEFQANYNGDFNIPSINELGYEVSEDGQEIIFNKPVIFNSNAEFGNNLDIKGNLGVEGNLGIEGNVRVKGEQGIKVKNEIGVYNNNNLNSNKISLENRSNNNTKLYSQNSIYADTNRLKSKNFFVNDYVYMNNDKNSAYNYEAINGIKFGVNGNSGAILSGGLNGGNQAWTMYRHCKVNPNNHGECQYNSNAVGKYAILGRNDNTATTEGYGHYNNY